MATRENKLADGIAALLHGHEFGDVTASAFRTYRYEETLESLATAPTGTVMIPVIPLAIPEAAKLDRKLDQDTILVSLIVGATVARMDNDSVDPWAELAESIQDLLRGPTARIIENDGSCFTRQSSPTRPAPSDAGWLERLVFSSQIVCEYTTGVSRR